MVRTPQPTTHPGSVTQPTAAGPHTWWQVPALITGAATVYLNVGKVRKSCSVKDDACVSVQVT